MAVFIDRVQDTASSVTTSTVTLAGTPPTGFQAFSIIGSGNTCVYSLSDAQGNWEINYGTYAGASNTLTRFPTPVSSSNAGALVTSFTGTVTVSIVDPARNVGRVPAFPLSKTGRLYLGTGIGDTSYNESWNYWWMMFRPIFIAEWFSTFKISINLLSLATSSCILTLGLYDAANGGLPGFLIGSQGGMQIGPGGATGIQTTSTITASRPCEPGVYWTAGAVSSDMAGATFETAQGSMYRFFFGGSDVTDFSPICYIRTMSGGYFSSNYMSLTAANYVEVGNRAIVGVLING